VRRDRSAAAARLGSSRFKIAAGKRKVVAVKLTRRGRLLARNTRRLRVTVTIRAAGRTTNVPATVR
jgi:hypothetical protein